MKAYAYLDTEHQLVVKNKDFIDNDNPGFWQDNRNMIIFKWKFDTEDDASMLFMFRQIRDIGIKRETVLNFAKTIGFDLSTLKDANKI